MPECWNAGMPGMLECWNAWNAGMLECQNAWNASMLECGMPNARNASIICWNVPDGTSEINPGIIYCCRMLIFTYLLYLAQYLFIVVSHIGK